MLYPIIVVRFYLGSSAWGEGSMMLGEIWMDGWMVIVVLGDPAPVEHTHTNTHTLP